MKPHGLILSLLLSAGAPPHLCAQTIDAIYGAKIAGLDVGQTRISGEVTRSSYRIRMWGHYAVPGFFSGAFDATAVGAVIDDVRVSPSAYLSSYNYRSLFSEQRGRKTVLVFEKESARVTIDPPLTPVEEQDRVPLRESDRRGVIDPVSAVLETVLRAGPGDGGCPRTQRVFSGVSRFDLIGSAGPVTEGQMICRVDFEPIAGHRRTTTHRVAHYVLSSKDPAWIRLPISVEVRLPIGSMMVQRLN